MCDGDALANYSKLFLSYFSEYQVPNVVYPDFDNFEVENKTEEWQKHFKFTLEECKLEDFQHTVRCHPFLNLGPN